MKAFHPSNVVPLRGLLFLLLAVVVGGAAIGGLTFLVDKLVYLVCLFPILMGLGGGLLLAQATRLGKVRNPWVVGLFGLLMGAAIYGSYMFFSYLGFREDINTEITSQYGGQDRAVVDEFIDLTLEEEYGAPGFFGYMSYLADEGVQIGRVGSSSSSGSGEINLQGGMTWAYWGVELLLVIVAAVFLGRAQSVQPFCESCDEWLGKENAVGFLGLDQFAEGKRLAQTGMFRPLGEMLLDASPTLVSQPHMTLSVESCKNCMSSDSRLTFKQITFNKKKQVETKVILQGMITPSQLSDLNYGLRSRPAAEVPPPGQMPPSMENRS